MAESEDEALVALVVDELCATIAAQAGLVADSGGFALAEIWRRAWDAEPR